MFEVIKGTCVDISSEGKGVVKSNNRIIFVDSLLLGEEAEIEILYKRAGVEFGKIKKLITFSKDRVNPLCPIATSCGGCCFQNATYEYELKYKHKKVVDAFHKIAHIDFPVDEVVKNDNPLHYRNKIQVPFQFDHKKIVYGFYKTNTHKIIPFNTCYIEDERSSEILNAASKLMTSMHIDPYNEDTRHGVIRHILIRTSNTTNEVLVTLITNVDSFPSRNNFVKELVKICPYITTITQNINSRQTNVILGEKERILYGKGYINDSLLGLEFTINSKSFYQVNPKQTEKLYSIALKYADIQKNETVLDAYAGVATIGLLASKYAKEVTSVELVKEACISAKNNAKRNNINNIRIINEDCTKYILNNDIKYDVVIMDPPRKGSTPEFLNAILKLQPTKIVYISCDPSTLARDIQILSTKYNIGKISPVDMFSKTHHVETVSLLKRRQQ